MPSLHTFQFKCHPLAGREPQLKHGNRSPGPGSTLMLMYFSEGCHEPTAQLQIRVFFFLSLFFDGRGQPNAAPTDSEEAESLPNRAPMSNPALRLNKR